MAELLKCLETHPNDMEFHKSGLGGILAHCQKHNQTWYLHPTDLDEIPETDPLDWPDEDAQDPI